MKSERYLVILQALIKVVSINIISSQMSPVSGTLRITHAARVPCRRLCGEMKCEAFRIVQQRPRVIARTKDEAILRSGGVWDKACEVYLLFSFMVYKVKFILLHNCSQIVK